MRPYGNNYITLVIILSDVAANKDVHEYYFVCLWLQSGRRLNQARRRDPVTSETPSLSKDGRTISFYTVYYDNIMAIMYVEIGKLIQNGFRLVGNLLSIYYSIRKYYIMSI